MLEIGQFRGVWLSCQIFILFYFCMKPEIKNNNFFLKSYADVSLVGVESELYS